MLYTDCKTFESAVALEQRVSADLMIEKQKDYGHANITAFGELGVLVRANDKMARLINLLHNNKEPSNESIEDSWRDLMNYATIALMLRHGTFQLELGDE